MAEAAAVFLPPVVNQVMSGSWGSLKFLGVEIFL